MNRSSLNAILIAVILLVPLIFAHGGERADAVIITEFVGGSDSVEFIFTGPGKDAEKAKLEIAPNSTIENATMRVRAGPDGSGNYPWNVSVDIGDDDDNEWRFAGEGYGRLGHQELFNDSLPMKLVSIGSPGGTGEIYVRLPAEASVDHASMELEPYGVSYALDESPPTGIEAVMMNGEVLLLLGEEERNAAAGEVVLV